MRQIYQLSEDVIEPLQSAISSGLGDLRVQVGVAKGEELCSEKTVVEHTGGAWTRDSSMLDAE